MVWKFVIPLQPKGAARARSAAPGGDVRVYPERHTENWKAAVAYTASKALPAELLEGPVRITLVVVLPRPKRLCERSKRTGELKAGLEEGFMWAPVKPDEDNIKKGLYDGLKAIWRDDCQITFAGFAKVYSEARGKPRLVVGLERLTDRVPDWVREFADEDVTQRSACADS